VAHEGRPPATLKSMTATAADDRRDSDSVDVPQGLRFNRIQIPIWGLVVAALALIGVLQWLPFGLNIGRRTDGWTLLSDVDKGMRPYIFISSDLVTRPFFFWIWIVNHHFDPDNFVLLNVILMVMEIVRGTALYALVRQLFPRQVLFAFMAGALLMVFPADSGTYYEGATHVLLSFTLQLVAVNLLILYWRNGQWWQLVLALVFEGISIGNYEIGIPLYLATPLVLWWLDRRPTLRLALVTPLWWLFPGFSLVVAYADVFFNPASHHSTMLDTSGVPYSQKVWNAIQVQFWTPYAHGFTDMVAAFSDPSGRSNLAAALASTLIAAVTVLVLRRHNKQASGRSTPDTPVQWLLVGLASFFAMLLGIVLFLPSDQLNSFASYQPVRLFYFSAIGAVGATVSVAFAVDRGLASLHLTARLTGIMSRFRQILRMQSPGGWLASVGTGRARAASRYTLASTLVTGLFAIGVMSLMVQHQVWRDYSWQQQRLLGDIMRQTGHIQDGTLVFVIDRSNGALDDYIPFNYVFEGAFQLVEDNYTLHARLCYNNASDPADTRYCHFTTNGIAVPDIWAGGTGFAAPYDHTIGFVLNADRSVSLLDRIPPEFGAATGYNPRALFDPAAGPPSRYYSMLTFPP